MDVRPLVCGVFALASFCTAAPEQSADSSSNHPAFQLLTPSELPTSDLATNSRALIRIGYSFYEAGEYEKALGALRRTLSLAPTNYYANLYLGYTYYYLTNFEAAAAAFKTAAQSRPEIPDAQYWLASTLYRQERYAEAIQAFRATVALNTNQPAAWLYMGVCQFDLRDYRAAVDSLQQCTAADPANSVGHMWLGYSLARLGRYEQASAAFGRAASLTPEDYDANYWHSLMLLRARRFDQAIPPLERALASRPGDRPVRWLLFASYLSTGQTGKISSLHLGLALPMSILLVCAYVPTLALLLWGSLKVRTNPSPGLLLSIGWFGTIMVGQTAFVLVALFAFSWPASRALWLGVSLSAAPLIAASLLGFARQPWGAPFTWPPRMPGVKMILAGVAALIGVLVFDGIYEWLVVRVTGRPMPSQLMAPWIGASAQQEVWLAFIAVGLIAPAAEEILFRGLLFAAIGKWLSAGWTIVVTAALFGMVHLQLIYFVPVFAVGLMLGWVRQKSGGLVLPIMLHCLNNSTAMLIVLAHGGAT